MECWLNIKPKNVEFKADAYKKKLVTKPYKKWEIFELLRNSNFIIMSLWTK